MFKRTLCENTGSALVELAVTAPFLLLLVIGSAELGRIAYAAIEVQNAARAAAAYAAQDNSTDAVSSYGVWAEAAANEAPNISSLTVTPNASTTTALQACTCETITTGSTDTITYSNGTTSGSSTPVFDSCKNIASDAANCNPNSGTTPPAGQTSLVVPYVKVTTSATVHTMFSYPGIPTTFTLTGYSQMRMLDNP